MTGREKLSIKPSMCEFFEGDRIVGINLRIPSKVGNWLTLVSRSHNRSVNNLLANFLSEMMLNDESYHHFLEKLETT